MICKVCKKNFSDEELYEFENERIVKAAKEGFDPFEKYPYLVNPYVAKGLKREDCLRAWTNEISASFLDQKVCSGCKETLSEYLTTDVITKRKRIKEKQELKAKPLPPPKYRIDTSPEVSSNFPARLAGIAIILLCLLLWHHKGYMTNGFKLTDARQLITIASSSILFLFGMNLIVRK